MPSMLLTSSISRFLQRIHYQSLCQSSLIFSMTCHNELRIANSVHYTTLATWQIGLIYSPFHLHVHASSWLQVVPFPRLGFDLAPNEMQWSIKWWLGLPLTPEVGVCAYCPDKALDAHHAVTCKFGGVARYNTLRNAIFDFCKRALLNPKLLVWVMKGGQHDLQIYSFQAGPLVISLQPLMCPSLLRLNQVFYPKRVWLQVQQQGKRRRESTQIMIRSALNWVGSVFH